MELKLKEQALKALSVQVIEIDSGVILKRGVLETRIAGDRAKDVIEIVLTAANSGSTREKIVGFFAAADRPAVNDLIDRLIDRGILLRADEELETPQKSRESSLEVFYWNFGQRAEHATARLNERRIAILGVNHISQQLAVSLAATGVDNVEIIDFHLLRNLRLFRDDGSLDSSQWTVKAPLTYQSWGENIEMGGLDCLVATSDFGGLHWMRSWNEFCVAKKFHFLPVVLQNLIGYVGPLVVPGETACFECLRMRQNSHLMDPEVQRIAEVAAFDGQLIVGCHPSMAWILGDIAAMELAKFYGGGLPFRRVGTLIEVNLLQPSLTSHKVLKVPRCSICSVLKSQSSATASRSTFLPGNRIGQ